MAEQWYYYRGEMRFGPVSHDDLIRLAGSGELLHTDLLWKEGMSAPLPAGQFKALLPAAAQSGSIPASDPIRPQSGTTQPPLSVVLPQPPPQPSLHSVWRTFMSYRLGKQLVLASSMLAFASMFLKWTNLGPFALAASPEKVASFERLSYWCFLFFLYPLWAVQTGRSVPRVVGVISAAVPMFICFYALYNLSEKGVSFAGNGVYLCLLSTFGLLAGTDLHWKTSQQGIQTAFFPRVGDDLLLSFDQTSINLPPFADHVRPSYNPLTHNRVNMR